MARYTHNSKGAAVCAGNAVEAATILARRAFGQHSTVESFYFVARTWKSNGFGGSAMASKSWRAKITTVPTDEERRTGLGYTRRSADIIITEGSPVTTSVSRWGGTTPPELLKTGPWRHIRRPSAPPQDLKIVAEQAEMAAQAAAWHAADLLERRVINR